MMIMERKIEYFDKDFHLSLIKNATKHVNRYLSNTGNVSETLASILNSY